MPVGPKRWTERRAFMQDVAGTLGYVAAFRSLNEGELHRLFRLSSAGGSEHAPQAMRRAARFLWRERHLRGVGGDSEAEALIVLALVLLGLDTTGSSQRLRNESLRRHRALSAWWWSATLVYRPVRDDVLVKEKTASVIHWIRADMPEAEEPGEIAKAVALMTGPRGLASVKYGSRSAASRLILSLLLRQDPVDFVTAERIDGLLLVDPARESRGHQDPERVELHHVFPKANLANAGLPEVQANAIANIAPLSGATNKWISDKAPSHYVTELIEAFGRPRVDGMMRSHLLDADLLLDPEGFDAQINERYRRLEQASNALLNPLELLETL